MSRTRRYAAAEAFLRGHDEDWAALIRLVDPCRHDPKAAREPYEALVRAIAYQQLTAKAGDAMIDRLKSLTGSSFPTPAQIIALDPAQLRSCGFSAAKAATILAIAQSTVAGIVPTRVDPDQMDNEALITRLVSIKGVGRWTVEMLLMYSLERMDVLSADDFGVCEGYRVLKSLPEQPKPRGCANWHRPGRRTERSLLGIFGVCRARAASRPNRRWRRRRSSLTEDTERAEMALAPRACRNDFYASCKFIG
jgi:DNA-3-methyladenine glycosylase II